MNMPTEISNRKVVVASLTGSHNYNLNNENSDRDYKYFVLPTFEDLYKGKFFATSAESKEMDFTAHDVRKLFELVSKANLNFIEILFSRELQYDDAFVTIFNIREYLVRCVRHSMKSSTHGMFHQKMSGIFKGTETTQPIVDRLGYDTKAAHHALRCLYTLERYAETESMEKALWYEEGDPQRKTLLDIKNGVYTSYDDFLFFVHEWQATKQDDVFAYYEGLTDNRSIFNELDSWMMKYIQQRMK